MAWQQSESHLLQDKIIPDMGNCASCLSEVETWCKLPGAPQSPVLSLDCGQCGDLFEKYGGCDAAEDNEKMNLIKKKVISEHPGACKECSGYMSEHCHGCQKCNDYLNENRGCDLVKKEQMEELEGLVKAKWNGECEQCKSQYVTHCHAMQLPEQMPGSHKGFYKTAGGAIKAGQQAVKDDILHKNGPGSGCPRVVDICDGKASCKEGCACPECKHYGATNSVTTSGKRSDAAAEGAVGISEGQQRLPVDMVHVTKMQKARHEDTSGNASPYNRLEAARRIERAAERGAKDAVQIMTVSRDEQETAEAAAKRSEEMSNQAKKAAKKASIDAESEENGATEDDMKQALKKLGHISASLLEQQFNVNPVRRRHWGPRPWGAY